MAAPDLTPGQTLGHFRLIEVIGAGAFGSVHRARDTRLPRDVAIKVLKPKIVIDDAARKRFRREADMLSRLNHPNIESVFEFHSEDGIDYLVLEYVAGVSLNERTGTGSAPEKEVLALGIQLARGLAYAHSQRVLHRDLKPGNLRVRPDNVLKILDFGLAQMFALPEDETLTTDKSLDQQSPWAGTPAYLSPEQVDGKEPSTRSDIYSAGVVLYELATGSRPFPQRGEDLRQAILYFSPPPLRLKSKEISPGLEALILKCLEKNPERRYQSADDLLEDLKELARISGSHRPVAVPTPPGWWSERRRALLIISAVLLLVVATVVLWRKFAGQAVPPRMSVVVAEFENRTGDRVFDQTPRELISTALSEAPQVSVFPSSRLPEVLRRMQKPETAAVDENLGVEICTREGLQSVVSGSISKLGSSYLILARVLNCKGDLIVSTEKGFSGPEELPSAIDQITATIRHKWGESKVTIKQDSHPLALVTSSSLEALKLYSSGKQQLYLGNFRPASSLFKKAVELDDGFAMAHEYLGIAYANLGDNDRAGAEYERAAQLASRVTEKEREKILGDYARFKTDYPEAISHYQVLASLSPQDPAVHLNLAECYINQFRFDAAIVEAKKAADLEPSPGPRENLAAYYYLSGDPQRAFDVAQQVLKENPDDMVALSLVGSYYLGIGKSEEAERSWRRLLALGGDAASQARAAIADSAQTMDDVREAIHQMEYGITADAEMGNTHEMSRKQILLAELYRASGDRTSLANSLEKLPEPSDPDLIFLLGRLYARCGRTAVAERQLHRLEGLADRTPRVRSFSNMLQSEIAVAQGRPLDAIQAASQALQHLNSPLAIETLARAYDLAGERENAAMEYEILLSRGNERQFDSVDSPALHAVAAARYHLGVLYQSLGRDDVAQQQFSSFLNYAAQSDRTGPLYEDARKRLVQVTAKNVPSANRRLLHTVSPH